MRRRLVLLAALTIIIGGSDRARGQVPGQAPAPIPRNAPKVSVDMTILEVSGAKLAARTIEVRVGGTESVSVQQKNRTVSVDTTVNVGRKPGCYKIDLAVRDRTIDSSGAFAKTAWKSSTEPCDPQPITVGPKGELQVQLAVKSAPIR